MRKINRFAVAGALAIPFALGVPGVAMAADADQAVNTETRAEVEAERQDNSLLTVDLDSFENRNSSDDGEDGILGLAVLEIEDGEHGEHGEHGENNEVLGLF